MIYAKPIFRPVPQRVYQQSVHHKRFVYHEGAPIVPGGFAFVRRQYRNPDRPSGVRRQLRRNAPRRTVQTPSLRPPGWMEIIRQRTARYPKLLAREQFDVRDVLRDRYATTPGVPAPSIERIPLRPRLGSLRRDRNRSVQRQIFAAGKAAFAAGAHIGWLVVYMVRRIYGHNLRR